MKILKFDEFSLLSEKYLETGKQPLFHKTSFSRASNIMSEDTLKTTTDSWSDGGFISFTRNINFKHYNDNVIFEIDVDKLKSRYKMGSINIPGYVLSNNYRKGNDPNDKFKRYGKGEPYFLDIVDDESEERVYKNIKNLGKYIKNIYLTIPNFKEYKQLQDVLIEYIKKYKDIKVYHYNNSKIYNLESIKKDLLLDYSIIQDMEKEKELISK